MGNSVSKGSAALAVAGVSGKAKSVFSDIKSDINGDKAKSKELTPAQQEELAETARGREQLREERRKE